MVGGGETGTRVASLEIGVNPFNPFKIRAFPSNISGNALAIVLQLQLSGNVRGIASGDQDIITKLYSLKRSHKGDLDEIRFYLDGW